MLMATHFTAQKRKKDQQAIDCSIHSFGTQTAKQELIAAFISLD
jgi:hypothetical protein